MKKEKGSVMVLSYLAIRKVIGILGMLIPFLMGFGALLGTTRGVLPTVSNYYYTNMQDMLVGVLCAVALFLISYKGYKSEKYCFNIDNIASNVAGIGALGVAVFPMTLKHEIPAKIGIFVINENLSDVFHVASAAVFFVTIAFISIFLFTRTKAKKMGERKIFRNRVYVICGTAILFFLVLILLYNVYLQYRFPALAVCRPVFFLESLSLIAFGFSWLVKGETLFRDRTGK